MIDAELVGTDGKTRWSVTNADFESVAEHRVPGKTRFKSPGNQQDLIVDWGGSANRAVNMTPPDGAFLLAAPQGLAICGQKP